jgi:hypothetical protein
VRENERSDEVSESFFSFMDVLCKSLEVGVLKFPLNLRGPRERRNLLFEYLLGIRVLACMALRRLLK